MPTKSLEFSTETRPSNPPTFLSLARLIVHRAYIIWHLIKGRESIVVRCSNSLDYGAFHIFFVAVARSTLCVYLLYLDGICNQECCIIGSIRCRKKYSQEANKMLNYLRQCSDRDFGLLMDKAYHRRPHSDSPTVPNEPNRIDTSKPFVPTPDQ